MGKGGGGAYIPGWRVVLKGLVASTKTLCSAPCLLNRAELIWVCLGPLLSSLGRLSPSNLLPLPSPTRATYCLAQGHRDWTHACRCTYIAAERSVDLWARDSSVKPLDEAPLPEYRGLHQALFFWLWHPPGSPCTRPLTGSLAVGCDVLGIQRLCHNPCCSIYTHYKGPICKIDDVWVSVFMLWDRGSGWQPSQRVDIWRVGYLLNVLKQNLGKTSILDTVFNRGGKLIKHQGNNI